MSPKLDFGDTSCSSNLSSFLLSPSLGSNFFGQRQRKEHWVQRQQGSDSLLCHLWTQNQLLSQDQTPKSSLQSDMSSNGAAATPGCPLLTPVSLGKSLPPPKPASPAAKWGKGPSRVTGGSNDIEDAKSVILSIFLRPNTGTV